MSKITYIDAKDIYPLFYKIIDTLNLNYIDLGRVKIFYSRGTTTKAYARIYGFPRILQKALDIKPIYVIELVSENFNKLNDEQKIKVLIHEILHIPKTFSGALRPHGKYVNWSIIEKLYKIYLSKNTK